jgi:hypothetical protein
MWQRIVEKVSTGEISKAEVAEALERSVRRRNTRNAGCASKIASPAGKPAEIRVFTASITTAIGHLVSDRLSNNRSKSQHFST